MKLFERSCLQSVSSTLTSYCLVPPRTDMVRLRSPKLGLALLRRGFFFFPIGSGHDRGTAKENHESREASREAQSSCWRRPIRSSSAPRLNRYDNAESVRSTLGTARRPFHRAREVLEIGGLPRSGQWTTRRDGSLRALAASSSAAGNGRYTRRDNAPDSPGAQALPARTHRPA